MIPIICLSSQAIVGAMGGYVAATAILALKITAFLRGGLPFVPKRVWYSSHDPDEDKVHAEEVCQDIAGTGVDKLQRTACIVYPSGLCTEAE